MQLVARMDVTDYQRSPESNRYLSFIKGRAGRKVSDFFLEFLGAREGLDQRLQNCVLIQAVKDYCDEAALPAETQIESRKRIQAYCSEQCALWNATYRPCRCAASAALAASTEPGPRIGNSL